MDKPPNFHPANVTVYGPGAPEYESSVATSNLLYRFMRPYWVVKPKSTDEVKAILNEAYKKEATLTVKGGGHCYAGFSYIDKGVIVDLVNMNKVHLQTDSSEAPTVASLGGGAKWAHAYTQLVHRRADGYVVNGGRCPTVGVGGFVLGGGLSPFGRSFGVGCDTVKAITIVVGPRAANESAESLTVKRDDTDINKRELFWALCGAGGGNFGIVTEVEMDVQRLRSDRVVAGRFIYQPKREDMADFMDAMNEFYTAPWSNEMTIDSSWLCDLRQTDSELAVRFLVYYNGTKTNFNDEIDQKLVIGADIGNLLKRRASEEKSTRFLHESLVSQWSEETMQALPTNSAYHIYTSFVFTNNDKDTIRKITSVIRNEMKSFRAQFTGEQGLLQVSFIHSGGKAAEKSSDYTAYPWRQGVYHTYITIVYEDKWLATDMQNFVTKFEKRLRPFSLNQKAAFINFPDRNLPKDTYLEAYYGGNVARLEKVKNHWDPTNFWKWQQGIPPSIWEQSMTRSLEEPKAKEEVSRDLQDEQWEYVPLPPAAESSDTLFLRSGKNIGGGIRSLSDLGF